MASQLPIACSLSAAELAARIAEMSELGRLALLKAVRGESHAELRFAAGADVRERIDAIVAAEMQCCAFLTMRVTESADDEIVLTIDAPQHAAVVLQELVHAFEGKLAAP